MQTLPNISASSIKALKKCPMSWYLAYVQGVREVETADVLRIGTHWHKLMEYLQQDGNVERGMHYLNEQYVGLSLDLDVERAMLAYCLIGYVWRYQGDDFKVLATETRFEIPYGRPVYATETLIADITGDIDLESGSKIVGVMDLVYEINGRKLAKEYKTSGRDIDLNGDYWPNLSMGVQARMYVWASRIIGEPVEGIYYDVFRKPQIKPRLLSAKDTKVFLDKQIYMDTAFEITGEVDPGHLDVDGSPVEIKWNTKHTAFQLRESISMYGARILSDIYEDPDKYFMRKEVVVTESELQEFERELSAVYTQMEQMMIVDNVYKNEDACDTPYRCPFQAICYSRRNQEVFDGKTPTGYKRVRLAYGETE